MKLTARTQSNDWADDEFGEADFGDARPTQRLAVLARKISQAPHCSFPQALDAATLKAAYRFFDNPKVDAKGVLEPHIGQTLERIRQLPVVLVVVLVPQGTSEFNLTHLPATEGLGLGTGGNRHGFMIHSQLAVSPEGLPLGVLGMKTRVRPAEESGKRTKRKKLPIADKESVKWRAGHERLVALEAHCKDTHIVGISDREGDIYDVFMAQRVEGVDWLVRAAWNRRVEHEEQYLWQTVLGTPVLGETDLLVPASANTRKPARTARLALRCTKVRLQAPRHRIAEKLPSIEVFAIHALEIGADDGIEPLEWLLLSSVPTHTCEQALERLAWYARRWTIESWHRVLKSGCRVEARQFGNYDRFVRATALFGVISWRILYATLVGRLDGDLSCETLLQPLEWRALYCRANGTAKPPDTPPTLAQVVLWIAQLGSYLNRKHATLQGPRPCGVDFLPCTSALRCIASSGKTNELVFVGKPQALDRGGKRASLTGTTRSRPSSPKSDRNMPDAGGWKATRWDAPRSLFQQTSEAVDPG
ncbi:IS4 family transposase [Verminephrobacter eiseniae]|uniref:IS4 family transposase n=1 Tax=Verminephrobacter eiseniae TaxID=364317 RepID=UPI0026AAB429|nr:IS4 family transposase [Verminephrobacter eiseniae]